MSTNAKPILFSGPMVKAILAGSKTQTRRAMKPQPLFFTGRKYVVPDSAPKKFHDCDDIRECCPYGFPGDRLWVRETWGHTGQGVWTIQDARMASGNGKAVYRADGDAGVGGWFPSIHMPREFSRILLRVTDVRVQRLHDISETDAIAEGISRNPHGNGDQWMDYPAGNSAAGWLDPRDSFRTLWDIINGADSWRANPFVWAVSFTVEKSADARAAA